MRGGEWVSGMDYLPLFLSAARYNNSQNLALIHKHNSKSANNLKSGKLND